jgi:hypothetical protein
MQVVYQTTPSPALDVLHHQLWAELVYGKAAMHTWDHDGEAKGMAKKKKKKILFGIA